MDVLTTMIGLSPAAWERWTAEALAAEAARPRRLTEARARRPAHAPCDDPFCPWYVPFGRHLEADIQQRRRQAWAQQDRERTAVRMQALRAREIAEADGFLHDLRLRRQAAGLRQSALAARVGNSGRALRAIEARTSVPRRRVVARLRKALAEGETGSGLPLETA